MIVLLIPIWAFSNKTIQILYLGRVSGHITARKFNFLHVKNWWAVPGRPFGGSTCNRRFMSSRWSHNRLVYREATKIFFVKKLVVVFGAHSDQPYRFKPIKLPFLYIVGRLSILEFIQELLVVTMDLSLLILVPTLVGQIKDCATVWLLEKCFRFDMFFQFMTLARIRHQLIKQCTLLSFNDLGHFLYQSSITIFNLILSF